MQDGSAPSPTDAAYLPTFSTEPRPVEAIGAHRSATFEPLPTAPSDMSTTNVQPLLQMGWGFTAMDVSRESGAPTTDSGVPTRAATLAQVTDVPFDDDITVSVVNEQSGYTAPIDHGATPGAMFPPAEFIGVTSDAFSAPMVDASEVASTATPPPPPVPIRVNQALPAVATAARAASPVGSSMRRSEEPTSAHLSQQSTTVAFVLPEGFTAPPGASMIAPDGTTYVYCTPVVTTTASPPQTAVMQYPQATQCAPAPLPLPSPAFVPVAPGNAAGSAGPGLLPPPLEGTSSGAFSVVAGGPEALPAESEPGTVRRNRRGGKNTRNAAQQLEFQQAKQAQQLQQAMQANPGAVMLDQLQELSEDPAGDALAQRFRTRQCRNFTEKGKCPYSYRCMFAHGSAELRTAEENMRDGLTNQAAVKAWKLKRLRQVHEARRAKQQQEASGFPPPQQQQQQQPQGVAVAPGAPTGQAVPAPENYVDPTTLALRRQQELQAMHLMQAAMALDATGGTGYLPGSSPYPPRPFE